MKHAAVLVLVCALAGTALGGDAPIGDGHLATIRLGWDGFFPKETVAPVTILFRNTDPREHVLRVVASPDDGESVATTVTLPPGARKRIRFALRVQKGLTVTLSENGRLIASSRHLASPLPERSVLVVDGEPETLVAKDVVTGVIAFTTLPEDLPGEVACFAPFCGVILRMLDPSRLDPAARAGLDDFVRAGGTVVVMGVLDQAATRVFYDELPGAEERIWDFAVKRHGLGQVMLEPGDLGAPPDESTGRPAERRATLGLALVEMPRVLFPRVFVGDHPREAATEAGFILAAFLATYLLVAGPVFMFAFRRARPVRVLQATALLLLVFVGLGALTAGWLQQGTATIKVSAFVVIPSRGESLVLADVLVQSGGSRNHDISIEGDDVSATSFGRLGRRITHHRWSRERLWAVDASTTQRAVGHHEVAFRDHALPSFGETSLSVLASAKKWRPIPARIERGPDGAPFVVLDNDCGHALGATLVFERVSRNGGFSVARFPHLPRGAKLRAPLVKKSRLDPAAVGIPPKLELVGWSDAEALGRDRLPPRFVLVAEDDPAISVHATRATIEERSWRIQEVAAAPVTTAGYLGITVLPTPRGARITHVDPGSPAETAGWSLDVGHVLTSMAGMPVQTQDDVTRALGWAGPGAAMRIVTADGDSLDVQLADPPGSAPPPVEPVPPNRGGY